VNTRWPWVLRLFANPAFVIQASLCKAKRHTVHMQDIYRVHVLSWALVGYSCLAFKNVSLETEMWFYVVAEFGNMQNPGRTDGQTAYICHTFRCPVSISAALSGMLFVCSDVTLMWRRRLCAKDCRYYSSWKKKSVHYACVLKVAVLFRMLQTLLNE
jgi:hypothetical protein